MIKLVVTNCIFMIFALLCSVAANAHTKTSYKNLKGIDDNDQLKLVRIIESFPNFQSFLRGHIPAAAFNLTPNEKAERLTERELAIERTILQNRFFQVSEVYYYLVNSFEDTKKNGFIIPSNDLLSYASQCASLNQLNDICLTRLAMKPIVEEALEVFGHYNLDKEVVWKAMNNLIHKKPKYFYLYDRRVWKSLFSTNIIENLDIAKLFFQCFLTQESKFSRESSFMTYKCGSMIANEVKRSNPNISGNILRSIINSVRFDNEDMNKVGELFRTEVLDSEYDCGFWGKRACQEAHYAKQIKSFLKKVDVTSMEKRHIDRGATIILEYFND
ncbi:MAG: hypothetical protein GY909_08015 [Oligoflexia bacterium]|nr:hypothetical protein [Oligoflexia bacterium]